MGFPRLTAAIFSCLLFASTLARAEAPPPASDPKADAPPDVLTFVNGDRISGKLTRADSREIVFKPAMLDEIHVPWSNIADLKTARPFVVVTTDKKPVRGQIDAVRDKIAVSTSNTATVPVAKTVMVIDPTTYETSIEPTPSLFQAWTGKVNFGVNLVQATQSLREYTAGINLSRTTPRLSWLAPKQRTTINISEDYGKLTQAGQPDVRTDIFHAGAEQDEFLSQRLFAYGTTTFDHNISQGLHLQQTYGGGLGIKAIQRSEFSLEFKSDLHYTRQNFYSSFLLSQPTAPIYNNLLGSTFSAVAVRRFPRGMVWNATISATPAYNVLQAFQTSATSTWTMPVYRALSMNIQLIDNYLNNPQAGFKHNSLQFTSGFALSFK